MADDAVYDGNATASSGSVSFASPVLTWTGDLAVGAVVTISYTVTVNNPDTGDKQVINSVTSPDTGATCPPGATAAACRVTVAGADPGAGHRQDRGHGDRGARPGGALHGDGDQHRADVVPGGAFTDPLRGVLDDAAYNGDASATSGTVSFASPVLSWSGDLAPGASATVTYSVTVASPDAGNHVLANTVTSATPGSNCASGSASPACTATVKIADLVIVSSADVATTTPGGVVRFTGTFTNTGQVAYNGITISTRRPGVFDDAVPNGDQTATSGTLYGDH